MEGCAMSDHLTREYRTAEALADTANDERFGAGYLEYQTRTNIRDLCRVYGFEGAREIIAEMIMAEAGRKRITIDG
jgi:hypothetical protein